MKNIKIILSCTLFLLSSSVFAEGVMVSRSSLQSVSKTDVKRIFLGKQTVWSNGSAIQACFLDTKETNETFSDSVVNKTMRQYTTYWTRKMFSGGGVSPKSFQSTDEILAFVKSNEGAICYMAEAPADLSGDIKIVLNL